MTITYDEALKEHMRKKGMTTIAVEVVSSQSSDFDFTELHVHLVSDERAVFFKEKKNFHPVRGEMGEVLLPNYRLEYDQTLHFYLKKFWIFRSVGYEGVRL